MRPDPALLEAVLDNPGEPAPRLALADWFERHGAGPRAELIRSEMALRTRLNPAKRRALTKRVRTLMAELSKSWAADFVGLKDAVPTIHRGVTEKLVISEKGLAEHGEAIFSREPVLRLHLDVQDGKALAQAAAQPWFERVRWLKVRQKGDAAARALAAAPHARRLHSLMLRDVTVKALPELLVSQSLGGLRALSLTGNGTLSTEDLEVFSQGRLQLERLFMPGFLEPDENIGPLVEAEWLSSLKVLALNRNMLVDEDAQLLARSKVLQGLEWLELAGNEISAEGALVFKSAKVMPRLERLDLRDMWYDREELAPLRKRFGRGLLA
ncbi:TIGR02996 domain-containing protein [Hyalangium gracile]|uniref:TIGR02996 domain-containing protein n=1 Tax=Hyalangium gracile TaxID=394092 RepID=UPI001CCB8823|nr:TIGR02996 domain-containing protein [Hyalangium gracile]